MADDEPTELTDLAPPQESETSAAPAPTPQYVTREDFERIVAENRQQSEQMLTAFREALAQNRPAPAAPAPTAELSDDQLDAAINEGRMTQVQAANYIADRKMRELQRTQIDPLRTAGGSALYDQARTTMMLMQTEQGKPLYPHYRRYEKEIDQIVRQYPPGTVINRETLESVYKFVVGGHAGELESEAVERAVRQATAPKPEPVASGGRTGRQQNPTQQPDTAEVMGYDDSVFDGLLRKEFANKGGRSLDEQARKMGYKDWKAYTKMAAELEA